MFSRLTGYALALLMGVPLCWCCWMSTPAAAAEVESCPACKLADSEPGLPAAPTHDRPCCTGLNERNISPDIAAAPRLVLVDLQAWVWMRPDDLAPPTQAELLSLGQGAHERGPPRPGAPLYERHCALLL